MNLKIFLLLFFIIPKGYSNFVEGLGDLSCGQEGQKRCLISSKEFWLNGSGGCDRGLKSKKKICTKKKRDLLKNEGHEWISKSLKFQRELQADLPLNQVLNIKAHNTFNNKADGYLFENQKYSITDLLELGVRNIELDLHFFNKQLRLCHGNAKDLVCSPFDRLFFNGIEELNIWLRKKENKDEVVILEMELYLDGHDDLLSPLKYHLDDLIFRQSDSITNGRWPSINEIRKKGKNIIITAGPPPYAFGQFQRIQEPPNTFDGKLCTIGANYQIDPNFDQGRSPIKVEINEDAIVYARIYNGPKLKGVLTPEIIKQVVECNITGISADQIDIEKAKSVVWSWAENEPLDWDKGNRCVYVDPSGGWRSQNCDQEYPFACQSETNPGFWMVTSWRGKFSEGEKACNREFFGLKFFHPKNGWENARLYKNHAKNVWINYKNF
jgi:hypothetical protein